MENGTVPGAANDYFKKPINKKFFIQKLILIFVPLQKIRLKIPAKTVIKRFFI
jgi:hypothetical protein